MKLIKLTTTGNRKVVVNLDQVTFIDVDAAGTGTVNFVGNDKVIYVNNIERQLQTGELIQER